MSKFERGGAVGSSEECDRLHASIEVHDRGYIRGDGNGEETEDQLGVGGHVGLRLQSPIRLI